MYNINDDSTEDIQRKFNETYIPVDNGVLSIHRLMGFTRNKRVVFHGHFTNSQGKWVGHAEYAIPTDQFVPHPPKGGYIRSLNCVYHVTTRPQKKWRLGWRHQDAQIEEVGRRLREKHAFKGIPTESPRFMYDLFYPEYMKPETSINMVLTGRRHAMPISPSLCIVLDEQKGAPLLLCRQRVIGYWDGDNHLKIFEEVDWLIPFLEKQGVHV